MRDLFVKICGITRNEDAMLAATLGANAIGFIFYPQSKRFITHAGAAAIAENARAFGISRTGVFVNPSIDDLDACVRAVSLDHLQLHGHESEEFAREVHNRFPNHKVIKAIRLDTPETSVSYDCDYELLDPQSPDFGGTGKLVSWEHAAVHIQKKRKPVLLAGGLTPHNVVQAIEATNPFGIDLSSGVEDAPGIKSAEKLKNLFSKLGRGSP